MPIVRFSTFFFTFTIYFLADFYTSLFHLTTCSVRITLLTCLISLLYCQCVFEMLPLLITLLQENITGFCTAKNLKTADPSSYKRRVSLWISYLKQTNSTLLVENYHTFNSRTLTYKCFKHRRHIYNNAKIMTLTVAAHATD